MARDEYTNGITIGVGIEDKGNVTAKFAEASKKISDSMQLFKVGAKDFKDGLKEGLFGDFKKGINWNEAGKAIGDKMSSVIITGLKEFKNLINDSLKELNSMLQYSMLTNSQVRSSKFTYGFSSSQAYGFQKAKDILGIQSDEDLMYMNDQQSQSFRDAFTKYTEKYNQLADSGFFEKQLEYQIEMNEFKEDIKLEIIQFIMNNKETIKETLSLSIKFMEFGIEAFGWIINKFSGNVGIGQAEVGSVLNNYSTKTNNVSVSNTFNGVGQSDKTWLANAGQMTYEQLIQTLNG